MRHLIEREDEFYGLGSNLVATNKRGKSFREDWLVSRAAAIFQPANNATHADRTPLHPV
jgi:hypothetical protein